MQDRFMQILICPNGGLCGSRALTKCPHIDLGELSDYDESHPSSPTATTRFIESKRVKHDTSPKL